MLKILEQNKHLEPKISEFVGDVIAYFSEELVVYKDNWIGRILAIVEVCRPSPIQISCSLQVPPSCKNLTLVLSTIPAPPARASLPTLPILVLICNQTIISNSEKPEVKIIKRIERPIPTQNLLSPPHSSLHRLSAIRENRGENNEYRDKVPHQPKFNTLTHTRDENFPNNTHYGESPLKNKAIINARSTTATPGRRLGQRNQVLYISEASGSSKEKDSYVILKKKKRKEW